MYVQHLPYTCILLSNHVFGLTLYLDFADFAGGVHPAGHVHGVPPNIILRFLGANNPGDDGTDVDADPDCVDLSSHAPTSLVLSSRAGGGLRSPFYIF